MSNREKEAEVQKKQKQIDQVRKILSTASKVAVNRAKERSLSPATDITSTHDPATSRNSTSPNNLQVVTLSSIAAAVPSCHKRVCDGAEVGSSVAIKRPRVTVSRDKQSKTGEIKAVKLSLDETNERGSEFRTSRTSLEQLLVVAGVEVSLLIWTAAD